jgi:hypothetical protein
MGSLTEGFTGWCDVRRGRRQRERNGGGGARCRACGGAEKQNLMVQSVVGQLAEA